MPLKELALISPEERTRRNEIISALLDQLDLHAPGEKGHAERVAVYSVATGDALGLEEDELLTLRYAAELHDIGKLTIDSELLLANRPLEPEERVVVERHVVGLENVLPDETFLAEAAPLIRHHHERWSGDGYPNRLSSSDIPLGARIIGAAEALDVMLEGAPWRAPFEEEVAIAGLRGLGGTWFDPVVVDALLRIQPLVQPVRQV